MTTVVYLCADARQGETLVECECGKHRPAHRPHGWKAAAGTADKDEGSETGKERT